MFKKPAPKGHSRSGVKLRRTGLHHANSLAAVSLNATPRKAAKSAKVELSALPRKYRDVLPLRAVTFVPLRGGHSRRLAGSFRVMSLSRPAAPASRAAGCVTRPRQPFQGCLRARSLLHAKISRPYVRVFSESSTKPPPAPAGGPAPG